MNLKATKTDLQAILPLRNLFLQENNFQIRYNACHERGWSDSYLLLADGAEIGYGSVKGKEELSDRDAVFEFFVIPPFRKSAHLVFQEFLKTSGATFIECQSNDFLLSSMLFEFSKNIQADVILFEDDFVSQHFILEVIFRKKTENDSAFAHKLEPVGDFVLEQNGEIVATGGFMLHYNKPFADLYMEVREDWRRKGLGSFLLQEIKKECYLAGRVPAARCNIQNQASRATLLKAGFKVAGFMLTGAVSPF